MKIRPETTNDIEAVYKLTEAAFGRKVEANINNRLRSNGNALISLVAEQDGVILAHIMFSPVSIQDGSTTHTSVGLGPVAVLPTRQKQGLGTAIIYAGLDACRAAGFQHVFLLGHPAYYPRFGFQQAVQYDVQYEHNVSAPVFMCIELMPNSLDKIQGILKFGSEFGTESGG